MCWPSTTAASPTTTKNRQKHDFTALPNTNTNNAHHRRHRRAGRHVVCRQTGVGPFLATRFPVRQHTDEAQAPETEHAGGDGREHDDGDADVLEVERPGDASTVGEAGVEDARALEALDQPARRHGQRHGGRQHEQRQEYDSSCS